MSVTFFVPTTPEAWAIACSCGDVCAVSSYTTYGEAYDALLVGVAPICGDDFCAAYRPSVVPASTEAPAPEVNVSNVNARLLLDMLGLDSIDCVGTLSGIDMLGRVLMAQGASVVDAGIPVTQTGNVIDCGREEGYADNRFIEIEAVARYAVEHNLDVSWS
jgi:hypothetical protein